MLAIAIAVTGVIVPILAAAKASAATTLIVNSTDWGGADANPGDGICQTAPGNGVCTLRAAIEESNALNGAPGEVVITVDESIPFDTPMTGTANATANFMLYNPSPNINRQDTYGAQYHVTAPVIIDLGHRLQATATANDNYENAMFYLDGPDIQVLNADHVLSSGSSFVVGPQADNVTINGDTMGVNDGFGQVATTANYNPERFVVITQGAKNVTVTNYQVSGYYNSNDDGGIFVFANPSTSGAVPANATRNVLIDRVQVLYQKSGTCNGSNGSGCNTRLVNFWQGTYGGTNGNAWTNNVIDGLSFTNMIVQNMAAAQYGFQFAYPGNLTGAYSADITDLSITNNQFINNALSATTSAYYAFITLPFVNRLHGTTLIADNVITSNTTGGPQNGQGTAIFYLGDEPEKSTNPSHLTIRDNYFNGFGNYGTVRLTAGGLVTVSGNTFGPATRSYPDAVEEITQTYVMLSNTPNVAAYVHSNQAILPWAPTTGDAAVLTGPVPAGAAVMTEAHDGAYPICLASVELTKPTSATTPTIVPGDPVTLQAYWTAAQTAEIYLGEVSGVMGPSATVVFPLPVGTVTLPDGTSATAVNATTGQAGGYVRFQTQVEGQAQVQSSQYSRRVPVSGICRPQLTLNQAVGMVDPTYGRDLHFTLTSSVPLDPSTVSIEDFVLTASPIDQTIDPARINERIVSVTPVPGTSNTVFDVIVRADDSATLTLALGAESVATTAGLTNPNPATSLDNEITFLNPLLAVPPRFTLVTGEPNGKDFTIELAAGAPLPSAELTFTASVLQPTGTPEVSISTTEPILPAGQTATPPVTVWAAPGEVVSNTEIVIAMTVSSEDSNYDGLVVPPVKPYLFSTDPTIQITKQAYVDVSDTSSPAQIELTGTLAPSGTRLEDRQSVCFVYTITNTSADDWETNLSDIVVTDSDTRLGLNGVIGTIPSLGVGLSVKLADCTVIIPLDTTVATPGGEEPVEP